MVPGHSRVFVVEGASLGVRRWGWGQQQRVLSSSCHSAEDREWKLCLQDLE